MTVIENLGRHSLPPLRRISSRDSNLQEEVGKWFWDRGVTQEFQLASLHLRAWLVAVVVDSGSGVQLVLLGVLLSGVRALLCIMPGVVYNCSTNGVGLLRAWRSVAGLF
jgi:hypothetical protein